MKPYQVDYVIDFAYGVVILISIVLIILGETEVGVGFGLGALVSYALHVTWKMARFDPEWMTKQVTESVEKTLDEEINEVIDQLEDVEERVDRRPGADEIEEQVDSLTSKREDSNQERQD